MSRTRIMLIVPGAGPSASAFAAAGADFPPSVPVGSPAEVEFDRLSAAAQDAMCELLADEGIPYVILNEARLDPSACMPTPASLRVACPGMTSDASHLLLPHRFPIPGFDRATLLAAGMSERDAAVVIQRFDPGPARIGVAA